MHYTYTLPFIGIRGTFAKSPTIHTYVGFLQIPDVSAAPNLYAIITDEGSSGCRNVWYSMVGDIAYSMYVCVYVRMYQRIQHNVCTVHI